jgi:hypothetical protein
MALQASAVNIAWVSFHADPTDLPSTAAGTFGFTKAPDVGYTDLLKANGHTVTRYLTQDAPNVSLLNSFDLVIISRSVNSGHYELDAETAAWNSINAPTIIMGGYTLRNNRLGFTTGTTIPDTAGGIKLTVNQPSHPIFNGVALDGTNTMVNDYASVVSLPHAPNTLQRGISVNTNAVAGGGQVLATVGTAADPAVNGMVVGYWPTGSVMGTAPPDTLGGPRLVFLSGSREAANQMIPAPGPTGTSSETAGIYDLSQDGARMFLNAVNFMAAIPEPSTVTLILIAVAGLGLIRKR